jgi:predicted alpha/beta-fold hydrolase
VIRFQSAWLHGHAQTILSMPVRARAVHRERLELEDGDFLDLDWLRTGRRVAIRSHGLEGSLTQRCVRSLAAAHATSWDVLAWNSVAAWRNRRPLHFYHSGETTIWRRSCAADRDLSAYLARGIRSRGNVTLKYLGIHRIRRWSAPSASPRRLISHPRAQVLDERSENAISLPFSLR